MIICVIVDAVITCSSAERASEEAARSPMFDLFFDRLCFSLMKLDALTTLRRSEVSVLRVFTLVSFSCVFFCLNKKKFFTRGVDLFSNRSWACWWSKTAVYGTPANLGYSYRTTGLQAVFRDVSHREQRR